LPENNFRSRRIKFGLRNPGFGCGNPTFGSGDAGVWIDCRRYCHAI
jgi:hypothetical protein